MQTLQQKPSNQFRAYFNYTLDASEDLRAAGVSLTFHHKPYTC